MVLDGFGVVGHGEVFAAYTVLSRTNDCMFGFIVLLVCM